MEYIEGLPVWRLWQYDSIKDGAGKAANSLARKHAALSAAAAQLKARLKRRRR